MPEYRAYVIGRDGHFQRSIPFICESDDAATYPRATIFMVSRGK